MMNNHVRKGMWLLRNFSLFSIAFFFIVCNSAFARSPKLQITGKITGENNQPLSGVSVKVKNANVGAFTDNNGSFSINADGSATLVISYVGYGDTSIAVNNRAVIDIQLSTSQTTLGEVVVIGYGTASKRDLTGSIAKVSGKDIADKPNSNPVASLQGRVAGLSVVNNGTPGKAPDIRIRGTISIGSVKPLYVVDGVFNDNIDYINPNDIESIEILKDPSSLAIFGVRGAAGVIAVTTKRAKSGQVLINVNSSFGYKKLVDKIKMANAAEFKTLYEEEKVNIGSTAPFDYSLWTANTDWVDAVTQTGFFNTNNVSISASTEKNKMNMGFGYTKDQGIIKHEELQKLLFSFSDEFRLNKAIRVGFNFNGIKQKPPIFGDGADAFLNQARQVLPMVSSGLINVYAKNPYGLDSMNQDLYYSLPDIQNSGLVNPLLELENRYNKIKTTEYRMVASAFAEVTFLKNFTFKSTFYTDMSSIDSRSYQPLFNAYDAPSGKAYLYATQTSVNESNDSYRKYQQDHILSYRKSFGDHNLNMTAGFTTYYFGHFGRTGSVKQSTTGAPIPDDSRFWYVSSGFGDLTSQRAGSSQNENSTVSGLIRALYNYKNKYYINGSFRRDASSQISPSQRSQNFWAVGAAWELSKEGFMQNQKIFNFVKIKGSVGQLGNQNTYGYDYPYFPSLTQGTAAVFGDGNIYSSYSQAYLPDPNLKWETVQSSEVGLELAAFNNRLTFEAAYFDKKTKDLMTFIPGSNGVANGLSNIGSIKNSGVELSGSWSQKITNDLSVTISGNLTTYKNKVTELATKDFSIASGVSRTTVGLPIGYFYGYIVEGVYQTRAEISKSPVVTDFTYGPGDLKYKDVNGDGLINPLDRTIIGNPTPDFTYGGAITFNYKGFDLGVDFNGVYGNEVFRNWGSTESPFQRVNYPEFKLNRWHGEGTSNWDPILGQSHRINYEPSTYAIEDGSYFRLRNIQLGYNFQRSVISKLGIKSVRAFANIQNAKTWKNNSGYTPEYGGGALSFGVDNAGGAIPVVTTFGLNFTF